MMTPKEIFRAYAEGKMGREEMLKRASEYPYAPLPKADPIDGWIIDPGVPTWSDVSVARFLGQITPEDYSIILKRSLSRDDA